MIYYVVLLLCCMTAHALEDTLQDAQQFARSYTISAGKIVVRDHNSLQKLVRRHMNAHDALHAIVEAIYTKIKAAEPFQQVEVDQFFGDILILELLLAAQASEFDRKKPCSMFPFFPIPMRDKCVNIARCTHSAMPWRMCGAGIFIWACIFSQPNELSNLGTFEDVLRVNHNMQDYLKQKLLMNFENISSYPDFLLAWAAWCGSVPFISMIAKLGTTTEKFGHYAIESALYSIPAWGNRDAVVRELLAQGAKISSTALQLAQEQNQAALVTLLTNNDNRMHDPKFSLYNCTIL